MWLLMFPLTADKTYLIVLRSTEEYDYSATGGKHWGNDTSMLLFTKYTGMEPAKTTLVP